MHRLLRIHEDQSASVATMASALASADTADLRVSILLLRQSLIEIQGAVAEIPQSG